MILDKLGYIEQATSGSSATSTRDTGIQPATAGNHRSMSGTGDYGNTGLLLETQNTGDVGNPGLARHTLQSAWQLLATRNTQEVVLETLTTLGYNRQLPATQQHIGGGTGDAGNT